MTKKVLLGCVLGLILYCSTGIKDLDIKIEGWDQAYIKVFNYEFVDANHNNRYDQEDYVILDVDSNNDRLIDARLYHMLVCGYISPDLTEHLEFHPKPFKMKKDTDFDGIFDTWYLWNDKLEKYEVIPIKIWMNDEYDPGKNRVEL